ncbi:MAG: hypothetical protein ABJC12_08580 [Saprospiraceae bacterium]
MKWNTLFLSCCLLILSACHDTAPEACGPIHYHLLNLNVQAVKDDLDEWLSDLQPEPTQEDPIGHQQNLDSFVAKLNSICDLEGTVICYACVKTFPAQSEIRVHTNYAGSSFERIIDISTPASQIMTIINVHE